jgi:hypothetical protein
MPYIKASERIPFDKALYNFPEIKTKGELEYCITYLMKLYMVDKKATYTELHNCTYAAMHCADEFRRRHLDRREDEAMQENGDI